VPTWAGFLCLAIGGPRDSRTVPSLLVLDGLEPARDRRPKVSRVSHQAGLDRRVTPEKPGRRGMLRSSCRRSD
jgi:hypothetical protein